MLKYVGIHILLSSIALRTEANFSSKEILWGNAQNCSNEGSLVFPHQIAKIACFSCMCKNGQVECLKNKCPNEEGCFVLQNEYADAQGCCRRCKSCNYQGNLYESGSEWQDESDPCLKISCRAGVVTESNVHCYTPCANPLPPKRGECCPTCPIGNSNWNGTALVVRTRHDSSRSLDGHLCPKYAGDDPCVKCVCSSRGVICTKKACPVLQCPPKHMEWKPGECCPQCNGTRKLLSPPKGSCLLGSEIHPSGKTVKHDPCTYCSCMNSTSICRRETCSPLDCPLEQQILIRQGSCCPQCPTYYENKSSCTVGDKIYQDEESWQANECKSCMCKRGQVRCAVEVCSQLSNMACPPNMKLYKEPGACCPKCVEGDGVCTVFGDPHYRTFDGKFFSYQGSCKYELTADCVGRTFSIRVTNDARSTKTSSWTKTVSIRIGETKINLGEKMRVKINGQRVILPYKRDVQQLSVVRTSTSDSVMVDTPIGVKVLWDGNSFLEVSVPTSYKGKLCGLCGNYNAIAKDDLRTRSGRIVYDAETFAKSWQVGGRKACSRQEAYRQTACNNRAYKRVRDAHRLCKPIRNDLFSACHEKLSPHIYYKSCLIDMCECPLKKCYCESLTAYAHECQRLGILLPDWRTQTKCVIRTINNDVVPR